MSVEVREIAYGSDEYQLELSLRSQVLREPLGLRFKPEELALDVGYTHLGAFHGERLVGCLILAPVDAVTVKMRQVAVDPPAQGLGIGRTLVDCFERKAREQGFSIIELNARENAVEFYTKLGYEVYGEPSVEVTIPHRKMRKVLDLSR